MNFESLHPQVIAILSDANRERDEKLQSLCQFLSDKVPYYNWVGFYFANHENKTLHLGPYEGAATDHTVIPFGKGICGQVAESNANFVVNGINIGQIDIDSHVLDPFTEADERFLEFVNQEVAKLF